MNFKIRDSYALIDGKTYIDTAEDRTRLLNDCGEEFYNHVISLWDTVPDKSTYEEIFRDLRLEKEKELETSFNERVSGQFTTSTGYLMQFNVSDSLKLQGAITLMEAVGSSFGYITQANDETMYNISIETMKSVLIEMLNAYAQCHARKQELRRQITSAKSINELAEITISWPG